MTESKILELLARNTNANNTTEGLHLSKLSPDCVQSISKNISEILYNSLTVKTASNENQRLGILSLLQKWCTSSGNHFKIGQDNYDCFIDSLIRIPDPSDELQRKIELEDCNETCKPNLTALVVQHCQNLEIINKEKLKFKEIIRNRDRRKCGDNSSFVPGTLHDNKYNDACDSFLELEQLMALQGCEEMVSEENYNPKPEEPFMRQKQINLAYSLLNLKRSSRDMLLLTKILKILGAYETLQPSEVQFVNYLWHQSMPAEIPLLLLENFSFIYEKVLIKMCADALQMNSIQCVPVLTQDVQRIIELSSKSEKLRNKIKNLFYELYAYSGFSNKLCCFLTVIK